MEIKSPSKNTRPLKIINSRDMAMWLTNKRGFPIVWVGTRREDHNKFIFGYDLYTPGLEEACEEWRRMTIDANKTRKEII